LNHYPELVIFDLDGTLVDTRAWWLPVAKEGLRQFSEQTGEAVPFPGEEKAWSLVGLPDDQVFKGLLPPGRKCEWGILRDILLPIEGEVLRAKKDYLFPGTRALLQELKDAGVKLAVASNCGPEYLEAVLVGQGLELWMDRSYCLGMPPKMLAKDQMLVEAMRSLDAQTAVLVGDRDSDARAAKKAGIPFIFREGSGAEDFAASFAVGCAKNQNQIGDILAKGFIQGG
jgi:phosphoglycolate phosphatase